MTNKELIDRVERLLWNVSYERYTFVVREGHGGVFLQAHYEERDVYTLALSRQYTRKWLLSPEMTDTEIVMTALKCCITSTEHRCREMFLYRGKRIFGPHQDIEDLWRLCSDGREAAGGRDFVSKERKIEP